MNIIYFQCHLDVFMERTKINSRHTVPVPVQEDPHFDLDIGMRGTQGCVATVVFLRIRIRLFFSNADPVPDLQN